MFLPWDELQARFAGALSQVDAAAPARITNLRNSSLFFFLYYVWEQARRNAEDGSRPPVVVVTETTQRAQRMQHFLAAVERLVADREPLATDYLVFPDFEPQNLFEYFEPPVDLLDQRNQVLYGLHHGTAKVIVTSYKACWRRLPEPEDFYTRQLVLRRGPGGRDADALWAISREELAQRLLNLGYRPTSTVLNPGEYAVRGGLVDVYPIGSELPVRVDLFGEEIDALATFEPATQRTASQVAEVRILPLSTHAAHLRKPEVQGRLRDGWMAYERQWRDMLSRSALQRLREVVESDLARLEEGAESPRAGWYYRATASEQACLWSYLPAGTTVVIHEEGFVESESNSYFRFWQSRFGDWLKNGLSFLDLDAFYLERPPSLLEAGRALTQGGMELGQGAEPSTLALQSCRVLFTHAFDTAAGDRLPQGSAALGNPPAGQWGTTRIVDTLAKYPRLAQQPAPGLKVDRPVTVLSQFSARLREVLHDGGVYPEVENAILPGGFVIPGSPDFREWTVVTDAEVFGEIAEVAPSAPRRFRGERVRRSDELTPGAYVVHIDYGIGRFAQLTERQVSGVTKTYAEIEYAERDRLYVPVEQLDRLRRYSFDGSEPQLNHLGRDTWKKTKDKVKHDTLELARKLLSLYKMRMVRAGHSYGERTVWEQEFAEGFPYELTEDQVRALQEVEQDMQSAKPMERLLVGDVGFGKTEVAMRAAFKACVDDRQVLVLCPTTVLADQHFHTFGQRFKPFPFRVVQLSRFQSKKEQAAAVEQLRDGRADVVIATHRALSKDVVFKRLGLLVIDEEQRFGVKQKEQLKLRWPGVDVLSMSATPIPRTLHMSLIGVRDISLIETAPVARKAVKTYVGENDEILIKEAILRELGRGGQVYYLHNRVQDIDAVREWLERLVTDVKVIIGHGQMREDRLEEVMHAFSLGAYKILLATTIIENGLDIPTVNTIVLDDAENLGLAQMHQLRGRVGRSAVQAYAYFFHQPQRLLSEEAQNRLHAIYNYAYLGAGYEIAQSDLRIRGAGNLLGEAQSGLARAVGFEYYCELLARSISDVKALDEADIEDWEDAPLITERPAAQLDLPLASYIPDAYIDDPVLRLEVLRDLAALSSEEAVNEFHAALTDRFGDPPPEVRNLLAVVRLRNLATALSVELLAYHRVHKRFEIQFFADEPDWFKKALLLDSRFSRAGTQGLQLALEFTGAETVDDLYASLETLQGIRNQFRR